MGVGERRVSVGLVANGLGGWRLVSFTNPLASSEAGNLSEVEAGKVISGFQETRCREGGGGGGSWIPREIPSSGSGGAEFHHLDLEEEKPVTYLALIK